MNMWEFNLKLCTRVVVDSLYESYGDSKIQRYHRIYWSDIKKGDEKVRAEAMQKQLSPSEG